MHILQPAVVGASRLVDHRLQRRYRLFFVQFVRPQSDHHVGGEQVSELNGGVPHRRRRRRRHVRLRLGASELVGGGRGGEAAVRRPLAVDNAGEAGVEGRPGDDHRVGCVRRFDAGCRRRVSWHALGILYLEARKTASVI